MFEYFLKTWAHPGWNAEVSWNPYGFYVATLLMSTGPSSSLFFLSQQTSEESPEDAVNKLLAGMRELAHRKAVEL